MDLVPPSEHQVLVFLVALGVLVASARALGALSQRLGQPSVIGELAAGLILGPSVLGRIAPGVENWLFPPDRVQTAMLFTLAWLGVIFLLVATGFETDLGLIRRLGRAAGVVSAGSLIVPIAGGLLVGAAMPDLFLNENNGDRRTFALFMGAALSISSLPVIAKILSEMGYTRRNFGQLTLAAGMANDVVGWVALGVIAGLAHTDSFSLTEMSLTVGGIAAFFVFAFTIGQRSIDVTLRWIRHRDLDQTLRTSILVVMVLAGAAATQWLGVEAVLGAFVVGILVGRSPYRDAKVLGTMETTSAAFLAPVFFATAGLRVDLGLLNDPTVAFWGVVMVAVATASKVLGAMAGGRLVRLPIRESAALGVALNARGAMGIVIAAVGLTLEVLNIASYTLIVLMAIATSIMAPPLLRWVLAGWPGTSQEQERLQREKALASNLVVRTETVVIPSRGGPSSMLAAQVVDLAWPDESAVTVLVANGEVPRGAVEPLTGLLSNRKRTVEMRPGVSMAEAVTQQARLGSGAVVVGLSRFTDEQGLPESVRQIVAATKVPVVLVRRPPGLGRRTPWAFGRALVPVAGGRTAQAAQEIAFGISARIGTETVLAHISTPTTADAGRGSSAVTQGILAHAAEQATNVGARVQTVERASASAAEEILVLAKEVAADVVVVGATRRKVADQHFLGNTATEVLRRCDATVIAVILPETPE